jgi:hypothetical protein
MLQSVVSDTGKNRSVLTDGNGYFGTATHVIMRKEEIIDILRAIDGMKRKLQTALK